jgi:hypothetical protein
MLMLAHLRMFGRLSLPACALACAGDNSFFSALPFLASVRSVSSWSSSSSGQVVVVSRLRLASVTWAWPVYGSYGLLNRSTHVLYSPSTMSSVCKTTSKSFER